MARRTSFAIRRSRAPEPGIGVLLDWVPGHFPTDAHGLVRFDGTALYEHADPREGYHPDWNTLIYNYGRAEVSNYLAPTRSTGWRNTTSTDCAWMPWPRCSTATIRGKRASGSPNVHGGRENLEAIAFLQAMNQRSTARSPAS
jgi:1,4-alpha-glucan branching enzyme